MYLTCNTWRSLVLLFKHCTKPCKIEVQGGYSPKAQLLISASKDSKHKSRNGIVLDFFVLVFSNLPEEDNFSAHCSGGGRKLVGMRFLGSLFLQLTDSVEGRCD